MSRVSTAPRLFRRRQALLAVASALALPSVARAEPQKRVVLELFTSQGCSACRPAISLIQELARRPDVVPLSFHVTYWDSLGWRDPFGLSVSGSRQRSYRHSLHLRQIYTPQMVVQGAAQGIGSDRATVEKLIEQAPPLTLALQAELRPGPPAALALSVAGTPPPGGVEVWLAAFDHADPTHVTSGENAGLTLPNTNVVRWFAQVGTVTGPDARLTIEQPVLARCDAAVVLLQRPQAGPILGAAQVALR